MGPGGEYELGQIVAPAVVPSIERESLPSVRVRPGRTTAHEREAFWLPFEEEEKRLGASSTWGEGPGEARDGAGAPMSGALAAFAATTTVL